MAEETKQVNANWDNSKSGRKNSSRRHSPLTVIFAVMAILSLMVAAWALSARGQESEPEITSTTILNSFSDVSDLVTQVYGFSGVGHFEDSGRKFFRWDVPFTGKSFLITYSGVVTAGIDFSEVDVKLDNESERITVLLTEPRVLSAVIDPDSVAQYDQSHNPVNQIAVDDVTGMLSELTDGHRQEAIDGGLLTRAEEQAELLLYNQVDLTIRGTEAESYEIVFQWRRTE